MPPLYCLPTQLQVCFFYAPARCTVYCFNDFFLFFVCNISQNPFLNWSNSTLGQFNFSIVGIGSLLCCINQNLKNKKMPTLHIFIIEFAICNLVCFVTARPTEFDFNSNIISVINRGRSSNTGNFRSLLYVKYRKLPQFLTRWVISLKVLGFVKVNSV